MVFDRTVQAVLLDVDGTLADSNHQHAVAWQRCLEEFGFDVPYAEIRSRIGMGGDQLIPALTGIEPDSARGKRIARRRGEIFRSRFLPSVKAFPGARALLGWLKERGYRLAVATSSSREDLDALLRQCALAAFVDVETSASDAESSKPAPDIVLAALRKAGAAAAAAVMLGDTPYDVAAARRAGVRVIAFTCGGWDAHALQGADEIYAGPAELLAALSSSGRRPEPRALRV